MGILMNCKICGASLAPGEVFCKNCGASNTDMEPKAPTIAPMGATAPVPPEVAPSAPEVPGSPMPPAPPMMPPMPEEPVDPSEATPEPPKEEAPVEKKNEPIEKKDNGKFLVVIGVIVGLLATAVIGYLIYGSLAAKNEANGDPDVVVTKETNYSVIYAGYKFTLPGKVESNLDKYLELRKDKWNAKITYSENPAFSKITSDNIKKAFEEITEYKVGATTNKTYSNVSCFEAPVDYTDGTKTLLLLCNRAESGYWYIEIGSSPYSAYPTSDMASEVVTILSDAKKDSNSESRLKIENFNITVEEPTETPAENQ